MWERNAFLLEKLREETGPCGAGTRVSVPRGGRWRAQVARIRGQGNKVTTRQIPFTPRAKKVLELGLREALSLGRDYIDTEHILLGLVREDEGITARILLRLRAPNTEKIPQRDRPQCSPATGRRQTDEGFLLVMDKIFNSCCVRGRACCRNRMSDGTRIVSVFVKDHGLVVRWASLFRKLAPARPRAERVSDDVAKELRPG